MAFLFLKEFFLIIYMTYHNFLLPWYLRKSKTVDGVLNIDSNFSIYVIRCIKLAGRLGGGSVVLFPFSKTNMTFTWLVCHLGFLGHT